MLIHDVNPRWIIKPISRATWRTSRHGNGLFTGSRLTAFNLAASRPGPARRQGTTSNSNLIVKVECRSATVPSDYSWPGLASLSEASSSGDEIGRKGSRSRRVSIKNLESWSWLTFGNFFHGLHRLAERLRDGGAGPGTV